MNKSAGIDASSGGWVFLLEATAVRSLRLVIGLICVMLVANAGCGGLLLVDEDVVYIAFGDSSTAGPSSKNYVEYLPELLNLPAREFVNQGQGGETTLEGLDRLEQLIQSGVYPNARTIVYWQGGTDVIDFVLRRDPLLLWSPDDVDYPYTEALAQQLDETQVNIERAIDLADGERWNVIVVTYFPIPQNVPRCDALFLDVILPAQAANAGRYVERINERIRLAAFAGRADLVDIAALDNILLADSDNYFDCNHLSATGNQIVALRIADAISESGQSP